MLELPVLSRARESDLPQPLNVCVPDASVVCDRRQMRSGPSGLAGAWTTKLAASRSPDRPAPGEAGGTAAGAAGRTSKKPESMTLTGFPWRSEIGYAEISHVGKMARCLCRVNARAETGVPVVGFEPTRACAQRCVRPLRLPDSPHQHLVGYEPPAIPK